MVPINMEILIGSADLVKADELFEVTVIIGKEVAHPNTTEHHISWITLFFLPDGEKFPAQVARYEFGRMALRFRDQTRVRHMLITLRRVG